MSTTTTCGVRVLVADDHAMMRAGLQRILENRPDICVCATAADGASTLTRVEDSTCNVLLLDLSMPAPNGPELIAEIRRRKPALPVLVMSMHTDPAIVRAALQAGASGYITKDSEPQALIDALRRTAALENYLDPRLAGALLFPSPPRKAPAALSAREREVLGHLAAGESNSEIARALFLSEKTVSSHKVNIMAKLNVSNLAELIRCADRRLLDEHPAPPPSH